MQGFLSFAKKSFFRRNGGALREAPLPPGFPDFPLFSHGPLPNPKTHQGGWGSLAPPKVAFCPSLFGVAGVSRKNFRRGPRGFRGRLGSVPGGTSARGRAGNLPGAADHREIRRITKGTQWCAKQAGRRVCSTSPNISPRSAPKTSGRFSGRSATRDRTHFQTCSATRPPLTSPFTGRFTACDGCGRPAKNLGLIRSRNGREFVAEWQEIRRITKGTQSCAERAGRRVCRRIFVEWLCRRPAKLEQERVSSGDSESPRNGEPSAAGGSRNKGRPFDVAPYPFRRGTALRLGSGQACRAPTPAASGPRPFPRPGGCRRPVAVPARPRGG